MEAPYFLPDLSSAINILLEDFKKGTIKQSLLSTSMSVGVCKHTKTISSLYTNNEFKIQRVS